MAGEMSQLTMSCRSVAPALVRLRSVAVLVDRPLGPAAVRWLREHLSALPPEVRRWTIRIAPRSAREEGFRDALATDELEALSQALGGPPAERRTVIGAFDAAASRLDDGATLLVVMDDDRGRSPGARWALRRARGSTLILPTPTGDAAGARAAAPRALLVARDASEIATLIAWSGLLPPGVEVTLQGVFADVSDASGRALADVEALRAALDAAHADLSAAGRRATTAVVLSEDPPDDEATLVVRVARRGLLRRLLPGPDARACRRSARPRLLIAPA